MDSGDYTVMLDTFQGPLDLLLQLIRRAELDITEIALATITDQFLAHVERLDEIDVDEAAEFLVVAATLIEVKSRYVNPEADDHAARAKLDEELDAGDPAAELLGQLLEYRAFREAGDKLEHRLDEWSRRYPAGRAHADRAALMDAVGGEDALDMDDLDVLELVRAFQRIVETVEFGRLGTHRVESDETPIELHAADVVDQLQRLGAGDEKTPCAFRTLFEGRRKPQVIGLFLAILELVRQRRVRVVHGDNHDTDPTDLGLVLLPEPTPDDDEASEPAAPPDSIDDAQHPSNGGV